MFLSRSFLQPFLLFTIASVSIAAPAHGPSSKSPMISSPSGRSHLAVRDSEPSTAVFWPYAGDPPADGLSPISAALMAIVAGPSTTITSPTSTAMSSQPLSSPAIPIQSVPDSWIPRIPIITSTDSPQTTSVSSAVGSNPNVKPHPSHSQGHELAFMAAIIGCIAGIGLAVAVCRSLAASGVCGWGKGRKTELVAAAMKKRLTWSRQTSPTPRFEVQRSQKGLIQSVEKLDPVVDISRDDSPTAPRPLSHMSDDTSEPTPVVWSRSSIPPHDVTGLIPPAVFFQQIDEEERLASDTPRSSRIRSSFASSISHHGRAKSAPVANAERPQSGKSRKSTAESEWDIARTYGAPQFDKTKSVGGVSCVSDESPRWV